MCLRCPAEAQHRAARALTFGRLQIFRDSHHDVAAISAQRDTSYDGHVTIHGTLTRAVVISTCAGAYTEGIGTAARLNSPWSIVYHWPTRSLFVADSGNNVVRRIQ